jgi:hypothetical protein
VEHQQRPSQLGGSAFDLVALQVGQELGRDREGAAADPHPPAPGPVDLGLRPPEQPTNVPGGARGGDHRQRADRRELARGQQAGGAAKAVPDQPDRLRRALL